MKIYIYYNEYKKEKTNYSKIKFIIHYKWKNHDYKILLILKIG